MGLSAGALALLLGCIALLVWGARWQQPRHNPFDPPSLYSWLLTPEPHRAFQAMPVVPLGDRLALVPRGLCGKPQLCGGLAMTPDGQARFRDDKGAEQTAVRVHRSTAGYIFALTLSGALFSLTEGEHKVWRQVSLPAPDPRPAEPIILEHDKPIASAIFSPDGSQIVTASGITARLWDTQAGKKLREFSGPQITAENASFSPDGTRVVVGSGDGTARLWDAGSGREIAALQGHEGRVAIAEFSPDGRRVVTASADGTARVWDARRGGLVAVCLGHTAPVDSASFSPDSKRVLTGSADGTARICDAENGSPVRILRDNVNARFSVDAHFSPDGTRVATVSSDRTARIWNVESAHPIAEMPRANNAMFSPDGKRVMTTSDDGTVRLWDAEIR